MSEVLRVVHVVAAVEELKGRPGNAVEFEIMDECRGSETPDRLIRVGFDSTYVGSNLSTLQKKGNQEIRQRYF